MIGTEPYVWRGSQWHKSALQCVLQRPWCSWTFRRTLAPNPTLTTCDIHATSRVVSIIIITIIIKLLSSIINVAHINRNMIRNCSANSEPMTSHLLGLTESAQSERWADVMTAILKMWSKIGQSIGLLMRICLKNNNLPNFIPIRCETAGP